jgi:hypothetical protein
MTKQFRRCHVCGTTNELDLERDNMVHACDGCGKHLAPFYFFEESEQSGISDDGLLLSLRKESIGYQPLWGFSVLWPVEEVSAQREPLAPEGTTRGFRYVGQLGRYSKGSRKD